MLNFNLQKLLGLGRILIPKEELGIFYLSVAIHNFAVSIVQIFIPIYLWQMGFSIYHILFFFILGQFGRLICLPFAAHFCGTFGAKKTISMAFVFEIVYFWFLRDVDGFSVNFFISAILFGAIQAFLWLPYLVHQSKISPNHSRGRIVARLNIFSAIGGALGPLVGGLVISAYGFSWGFALAVIIIIPAIGILFLTPEISNIRKIDFRSVSLKKIYPDVVANGFSNFQGYLGSIIWVIFMFILLGQYKTIGLIQTISLGAAIIIFYLIGEWTDKFNRKKLLLLGSVTNSLVSILRILANSFWAVFFLNTAATFTSNLQGMPWNVKLQEHIDQEPRTEYTAIFEMGGALFTLLGFAIFLIATVFISLDSILIWGMIIASLSGLLVNMVRE